MAESPQEFDEFIEAILQAWNEYVTEARRKIGDVPSCTPTTSCEGSTMVARSKRVIRPSVGQIADVVHQTKDVKGQQVTTKCGLDR